MIARLVSESGVSCLTVDGQDISGACYGATIHVPAHGEPRIEADLRLPSLDVSGRLTANVPYDMVLALVAAGWTEPS